MGILRGLRRDPSGAAEFIDENGTSWDIKSWRSDYRNGFNLGRAVQQIQRELNAGENVIINWSRLSLLDAQALRAAISAEAGWSARILWYNASPAP